MRFRFTQAAIDTLTARQELQNLGSGGYVSFEGWVRDHNEGQEVTRLEYEAFEELAVKEGERIVEEALRRFPVVQALCIHRVGALASGRNGRMGGCEFRTSRRSFRCLPFHHRRSQTSRAHLEKGALPEWRLRLGELRALRGACAAHAHGGTSRTRCRYPRVAMQPDYSRQLLLKEIGAAGQAALARARVLIVGVGRPRQSGAAILGGRRSRILRVGRCRQPGSQQLAPAAHLRARRCRQTQNRSGACGHQ